MARGPSKPGHYHPLGFYEGSDHQIQVRKTGRRVVDTRICRGYASRESSLRVWSWSQEVIRERGTLRLDRGGAHCHVVCTDDSVLQSSDGNPHEEFFSRAFVGDTADRWLSSLAASSWVELNCSRDSSMVWPDTRDRYLYGVFMVDHGHVSGNSDKATYFQRHDEQPCEEFR